MPSWQELTETVQRRRREATAAANGVYDEARKEAIQTLSKVTQRNVIVYYSGWLQKDHIARSGVSGFGVDDSDKNGFMAAIHRLDRNKGLDLLLHTPGGEVAATESLVSYLRSMFSDIRAIVPQLAMSAGTMIALAAQEIVMGKHSSLGPIDPQISGVPAHGIIEEFETAKREIRQDSACIPVWQPIIAKYNPTLIGEAEKAIAWSEEIVREWLVTGMFAHLKPRPRESRADKVVAAFGDHALTKAHGRHISLQTAKEAGIKVKALESDQDLQEAVLTVHHACVLTLAETSAVKIIENQKGAAYITLVQAK